MRLPAPGLIALWLAALAGFAVMAGFAAAYDTFPADVWLSNRLQDIDWPVFARMLDWAEDFADLPLVAAVVLAGAAGLILAGGREQALLLVASNAVRLVNSGLKEIIERPRPPPLGANSDLPSSFSFPSGHAEGAMVLYGLLIYFAAAYVPQAWLRLPVQAFCVWVILFTAMERVYVGHHWPSDVLGGLYFGALAVAAFIAVDRVVLRARRPVTKRRPFRY